MKIEVCHGKACQGSGKYIFLRLQREKDIFFSQNPLSTGEENPVEIDTCLCRGRCSEGPNIVLDGEIITHVDPVKAAQIFQQKVTKLKNLFKS